ncbi:hypothetical protein LINPERPRIM_LOCUS38529, partial [Linum perenne]
WRQRRHPLRPNQRGHPSLGRPLNRRSPQFLRLLHDLARRYQKTQLRQSLANVPLHLHRRQLPVLRQHRSLGHLRQELPREPRHCFGDSQRLRRLERRNHHPALPRLLRRRFQVLDSPHRLAPCRYFFRLFENDSNHESHPAAE